MTTGYTQGETALRDRARKFAREVIAPEALEYDRLGVFPHETIRKMGQEGLFAPIAPKEYGGLGLTTLAYGLVQQEVATASAGYTHNGMYQTQKALARFGTEEQKRRHLPKIASAESIAAVAISEHNVGSSFKAMETFAEKTGDRYVLNGHKTHINDAAEAHVTLVLSRTAQGLTTFLVERGQKGIAFSKKLDPTGFRSSPLYEFQMKDVELPETQRLGGEGQGLDVFLGVFNFSRIGNASVFVGISQGALEHAIRYARERVVGSSRVTEFQGIRWLVADLSTKIEAAVLLRDKAAAVEASGAQCARETSMAKYFAGETAREVTNKAMEMCGSFACYREQPFDLFCRDAKAMLMAGGSAEVMKNVIADLTIGK